MKTNIVYHGDCLNVIKEKIPDEVIDLIYLDPPFGDNNVDKMYDLEWKDKNHYLTWMEERIKQCYRVLKPTGSIYLHCDWRSNVYLKILMDSIFGEENFRREVIVDTLCKGMCGFKVQANNWIKAHDTLYYYVKDIKSKYTFNKEKPIGDVWSDIYPMQYSCISSTEGVGIKNKKPIRLIKRIILASSNINDIVLDPFLGTGTTGVAAYKTNRRFVGIERKDNFYKLSTKLLEKEMRQRRID